MKLTEQQVLALKRKRGEKNLSIGALAKSVGLSRWTISRIIKKILICHLLQLKK